MRRLALSLGLLGLAICQAPVSARADFTAYSNVTNFTGFGYPGGGAAPVAGSGGSTITAMVADDLTPVAGSAGDAVTGIEFSVANFNAAAVSASALVRFYDSDNAGGPGTLLAALNFNPISFAGGGAVSLFTYSPGGAIFTLPASGTIWAGIAFSDNGGTTGATAAQLNNLGQGLFSPPTVGSSQDVFFQSNNADTFLTNNPAGGFFFFGGNPPADFGWALTAAAVPEPSSMILMGSAGLIIAGRKRLARKRQANQEPIAA